MDFEVGDLVQIKDGTFSDTFEFLNLEYAIVDKIETDLKIIHLNNFQYENGNYIPTTAETETYLNEKGLWVSFRDVTKQYLSHPEFSPSAWDDVMEVI